MFYPFFFNQIICMKNISLWIGLRSKRSVGAMREDHENAALPLDVNQKHYIRRIYINAFYCILYLYRIIPSRKCASLSALLTLKFLIYSIVEIMVAHAFRIPSASQLIQLQCSRPAFTLLYCLFKIGLARLQYYYYTYISTYGTHAQVLWLI